MWQMDKQKASVAGTERNGQWQEIRREVGPRGQQEPDFTDPECFHIA